MHPPTSVCILLFLVTVVTCLQKNGVCSKDSFIEESRKTFQSGTNRTQTSMNIEVSNRARLSKKPESPENMYNTSMNLEVEVGYEGVLNPTCKIIFPKPIFSSKFSDEKVREGITSTLTKPNTFPSHGTVRELRRHMRRSKRTGNRKERFVRIAASSGTPEVEITRRSKRQMLESESAPNIRRRFKTHTHKQRKESSIRKSSKFIENRRGRIYRRSRRLQRRERKIKSAFTDTGRVLTKLKDQTIRVGRKKSNTEYFGQNVRRLRHSVGRNERRSRESVGRYTYRSRNSKTRRSKGNVERIVRRSNNNINRNKRHSRNITGRFVHHIKNSFSQNLRHSRSNKGHHVHRSRNRINRSVPNSRNRMVRTGRRSRKNINRNTQRSRNSMGRVMRHTKNSMRRVVRHRRVIYRRDIESETSFVVRRRRRKSFSKSKLQKSMIEKGINYRRNTQVNRKDSLKNFPLKRGITLSRRRFSRVQRYCRGLHSSSACLDRKVEAFRNEWVFPVTLTRQIVSLVSVNATQHGEECPPRIKHRAKTPRSARSYRIRKWANSFNSIVSCSPGFEVKRADLFVADKESHMIGPLDAFYELANKVKIVVSDHYII